MYAFVAVVRPAAFGGGELSRPHQTFLQFRLVAEGEGFEPPVPFQVQRFSRPPVSTTHTSLRNLPSILISATPFFLAYATTEQVGQRQAQQMTQMTVWKNLKVRLCAMKSSEAATSAGALTSIDSPDWRPTPRLIRRLPLKKLLLLLRSDEGQAIAEYAVVLAVILVLVVSTVRIVGGNSDNVFSTVGSAMNQ